MPDVVTFDGPNRVITEIANGAENVLEAVEVYSEWKVWVRTSDNAKYLPAFSQVGGDPITDVQNLGITFFLENGWRIRPAELNHKVTLVGNVYTREPGQSVFLPTIGAFTVNTETRVSSLVDSSVARLDLTQLLNAVYIDTIDGVPGTTEGIGTPTNPVSNITDAITIATRDKLRSFNLRGSIALPQAMVGYRFFGEAADDAAIIDLNGQNVDTSKFEHVALTGSMVGRIEANYCALNIFSEIAGTFRSCEFVNNFALQANSNTTFSDCFSGVPGNASPLVVFSANSTASFRNYSGGITVGNMTAGCIASFDLDPGKVTLLSSCVGGEALIRGTGMLVDNSQGTTVVDGGFLRSDYLADVWANQGGNAADAIIANIWAAR